MISQFILTAGTQSLWESIADWYRNSLICELLNHLTDRYFSVDLYAYDNFAFSGGDAEKMQSIILAIAIGLVLASAIAVYMRVVPGGFVRALMKSGADSPETARTLHQLGYFRSVAIRWELSRGVNLKKLVSVCDPPLSEPTEKGGEAAKNNTRGEKIDFLKARFYIPEELKYRAELRYCKAGSDPRLLIIVPVVALTLAALAGYFLPDVLRFADNLINLISG